MKITRNHLRQIIKKEIMKESRYFGMSVNDVLSYFEGFKDNTWIFFDTETTGLPGKEVYVGQLTNIGAVAVNPNNWDADPEILGEFNEMVEINPGVEERRSEQDANPDPKRKSRDWTISQALTNTGYHEWEGEYLDEQVVISNFINFVNSFPSPVLVAQNASFDMQWILARSETSMQRYPVIDTMRIMQYFLIPLLRALEQSSVQDEDAAKLLSKLRRGKYYSTSMGKVAAAYGIDTQNWHRALDDAKMLMQLFYHVVKTLRTGIDVDIGPEHAEAAKNIRDRQARQKKRRR
jgi:DNA polymerase III epsilon subunit-like protein